MEETRIYVAVAETVQAVRNVVQPSGRQVAQCCHVVSKLRFDENSILAHPKSFEPITTIILQVRDSAELRHVYTLLIKKKLNPAIFQDSNPEYGPGSFPTAIAVLATKKQTIGILDYLPMWGNK